ncbi:hypothetical protein L1987_54996 [Smallanthus sonchifolius]|uniref:Uncharacterized protein n=1 Tax=Smallanthus sonchifolius TaxID=185202 RepID=A0ACB9E934_9ASTR|nr:hypothetical protein L1987_54996 [Smallanthus sonchifolius]
MDNQPFTGLKHVGNLTEENVLKNHLSGVIVVTLIAHLEQLCPTTPKEYGSVLTTKLTMILIVARDWSRIASRFEGRLSFYTLQFERDNQSFMGLKHVGNLTEEDVHINHLPGIIVVTRVAHGTTTQVGNAIELISHAILTLYMAVWHAK